MKKIKWAVVAVIILALGMAAYWKWVIPKHRAAVQSELIMLGDLDGDHQWTASDLKVLDRFLEHPFSCSDSMALKMDLNQDGFMDPEDIRILQSLVAANGDPYLAAERAGDAHVVFPRPRELYRYLSLAEYHSRPKWGMPDIHSRDSVLLWLKDFKSLSTDPYARELDAEVLNEAVRFDFAWRKRQPGLIPIEVDYARMKLQNVQRLYEAGNRYEQLLALMELVEDAETLTARGQPDFSIKLLTFRDHLRDLLASPLYAEFKSGKKGWLDVLQQVAVYSKNDLGMEYDFTKMKPARNLTSLQNYLQRAEWQYYKSTTSGANLIALIQYAQHDPRYLRAVARTSRKLQDDRVVNHNLPMVLLFREALRIKGGDKKKAVALLDEAIRIPYGWIKSIPPEMLPGSLALDNFLLPGNKEDGADKSRHWNVFGGICLYKSPQEAVDLAIRREFQDLQNGGYTDEQMREFMRDMIANLNGMYHVMTVNPDLLGVP